MITAFAFALCASARAVPNPVEVFKRAHTPGVVINKCSKPGVLALAYDDGPYQYTSSLVDTLDKAGVKGTFFYTGTLYGMEIVHYYIRTQANRTRLHLQPESRC